MTNLFPTAWPQTTMQGIIRLSILALAAVAASGAPLAGAVAAEGGASPRSSCSRKAIHAGKTTTVGTRRVTATVTTQKLVGGEETTKQIFVEQNESFAEAFSPETFDILQLSNRTLMLPDGVTRHTQEGFAMNFSERWAISVGQVYVRGGALDQRPPPTRQCVRYTWLEDSGRMLLALLPLAVALNKRFKGLFPCAGTVDGFDVFPVVASFPGKLPLDLPFNFKLNMTVLADAAGNARGEFGNIFVQVKNDTLFSESETVIGGSSHDGPSPEDLRHILAATVRPGPNENKVRVFQEMPFDFGGAGCRDEVLGGHEGAMRRALGGGGLSPESEVGMPRGSSHLVSHLGSGVSNKLQLAAMEAASSTANNINQLV